MARTNGGIIGKKNSTSFGKCKQTVTTSNANITTQPGTRVAKVMIGAGGAGGGGGAGEGIGF